MLRGPGPGPGLETPVVTVIGEAPVVTVRGMLPTQSLERALLLQCHGDGAQVADSDSDNLKRPSVADYGRQGPQKASVIGAAVKSLTFILGRTLAVTAH